MPNGGLRKPPPTNFGITWNFKTSNRSFQNSQKAELKDVLSDTGSYRNVRNTFM